MPTKIDDQDPECRRVTPTSFTSVEVCAGAGGQALGLHQAGFEHIALVELEVIACGMLRQNGKRLGWADSTDNIAAVQYTIYRNNTIVKT